MKLTDMQKRYASESDNQPSLEHLKNQLSAKISSTLNVKSTGEREGELEGVGEFRFDMFSTNFEMTTDVGSYSNPILDLEKDIEKLDDKINIFVKKDGIILRNDSFRTFMYYCNKDILDKNKNNIYFIPTLFLSAVYLDKITKFVHVISLKYPDVVIGGDTMTRFVKSIVDKVSKLTSDGFTKKVLVHLIDLDVNIDNIFSLLSDPNISITNEKVVKYCQDIGTFNHNFDIVLKNHSDDSIIAYNISDDEIIFRHMSKLMINFAIDIYKSIQYDFYVLQKGSTNVFWSDVKGIIQNVDSPIKSLKILDISAKKHFEIIAKLVKSHKINDVLNKFPTFNLYVEFSECLFNIVLNELSRYISFETSLDVTNISLSSSSKIKIKQFESMINDNISNLKYFKGKGV